MCKHAENHKTGCEEHGKRHKRGKQQKLPNEINSDEYLAGDHSKDQGRHESEQCFLLLAPGGYSQSHFGVRLNHGFQPLQRE